MDITLKRTEYRENGIFGELLDEQGQSICVSLEHAFDDNQSGWQPAVPPGQYTCQKRLSPHFGYEVFQVLNVPGHTSIEIHRGNWNSDSEGCILLGDKLGDGVILNSKVAFDRFMDLQTGLDTFALTILE